jgi:hypothetical protein
MGSLPASVAMKKGPKRIAALREAYERFVQATEISPSPESAAKFSQHDGIELHGLTKRQVIVILEGRLPFGYID